MQTGGAGSELTNAQRLLWTGQQLHPAAPLYNMVLAFEIGGSLDRLHFERAWHALLQRSDALRAVFEEYDGVPRQHLHAARADCLELIDFSAEADTRTLSQHWMRQRSTRLFELRSSALDSVLLRLAPDRFIWYLNQHHLITDGWSAALVYRRMADLYARSLADSLAEAPSFPRYADYIEYERRFRASGVFQNVSGHWRRKLAVPIQPIRLYGRKPPHDSTPTERLTRAVDDDLARRVREFAAATAGRSLTHHTALFNVFASALFAWLHRASGQYRLTIGTPSHNRPTAAFKETIGVFIEVLPYTVEVAENESFRTLLSKVQSETAEFLRYAQPGTSKPEVNRSFTVLLNYIHASFPSFAGLPIKSEWIHPGHGDSAHHLRLQVHDFDETGRFVLHFDINAELMDVAEREAAADQFLYLLRGLLEQPDTRISELQLLSPAESRVIVERHGQVNPAPPVAQTVVDMFAAQAARTPDAIAVEEGSSALTYAQLYDRVQRLAAHLAARGVRPDTRVALHMERSLDAVIGALAVLTAGGAYVPVSPSDPPARVHGVLRDAGAEIVLTHGNVTSFNQTHDPRVPLGGPGARDAAYVIYTSGSTGRPKGVVIEHAALANYVAWASQYYGAGAALDFPLFTSLSFDLTVTSLFVPLVTGGRVIVYGETGSAVPALLRVLEEDRVDVIKLTPSHLLLLRAVSAPPRRLRKLILGGEDLRVERAAAALDLLGDVDIHNEYGPTEATVGCMIHRFDPATDTSASVPIGVPAAGATIYVLDAIMQPVPDGVAGEIWIGGPGLARGYLNDDERTRERFRPDPFDSGGRLYRTGDLGRWRRDGLLEFLGRADNQLKIRGARVEPGEVEAALLEHPAIGACVVDAVAGSRDAENAAVFCKQCGLPSSYPGVSYDAGGVCHLCRGFAVYRERASRYFRTMEDLQNLVQETRARRRGSHDCVMLLSGGKDSTYALYRLIEMGVSVYAFTLDNGYISEQAKANIRRVTEALGVEHVFGTTPHMNAIFVDSLRRHSNVCNGCFKTIYTLGARLAREKGIPLVMTGLSRGQFFETRLSEELFREDHVDVEHIDRMILEARKAYHRVPDGIAALLDTRDFRDDALFEDVRFVDFYRYCDVELDEMLAYLAEHAPWIRPSDTGRSTNCLINQVGIYVHKVERGFHNYAFPYSWDVRMGHKTREAALAELNDDIDPAAVHRILIQIGYDARAVAREESGQRLAAWYVARDAVTPAELREHLRRMLPEHMIPADFERIDHLPLTPHGKVDRAALPRPTTSTHAKSYVAPRDAAEERIASIWEEVLELERVGVADEFLDLGGNSLLAIRIISRVNQAFGVDLALRSAFEATTVGALARLVEAELLAQVEAMSEDEVQRRTSRVS